MQITLENSTPYVKFVVATDDNQNNFQVFAGNIGEDSAISIQIAVSYAGYGDIHYVVDGGRSVGSSLLSEGDKVSV